MSVTFTELYEEAKTAYLALLQRRVASYTLSSGDSYTYHDLEKLDRIVTSLAKHAARESGNNPAILLADISGGGR